MLHYTLSAINLDSFFPRFGAMFVAAGTWLPASFTVAGTKVGGSLWLPEWGGNDGDIITVGGVAASVPATGLSGLPESHVVEATTVGGRLGRDVAEDGEDTVMVDVATRGFGFGKDGELIIIGKACGPVLNGGFEADMSVFGSGKDEDSTRAEKTSELVLGVASGTVIGV